MFANLDDIRGFILAGTPADIARETRAYEEAGADHIVYDLRFRYADWLEQIGSFGKRSIACFKRVRSWQRLAFVCCGRPARWLMELGKLEKGITVQIKTIVQSYFRARRQFSIPRKTWRW